MSEKLKWPAKVTIDDQFTTEQLAFAQLKALLYIAYKSEDGKNSIWITSSSNDAQHQQGRKWEGPYLVENEQTSAAPALTTFNERLYLAYKTVDTNRIRIAASSDGKNWEQQKILMGGTTVTAPAMTVVKDKLYLAYGSDNGTSGKNILITSSIDGKNWETFPVKDQCTSRSPSMIEYRDRLYLAYQSDDQKNHIWIATTIDGKEWTKEEISRITTDTPSMTKYREKIYIAYKTEHYRINYIQGNGNEWLDPQEITGEFATAAPTLTAYNHQLEENLLVGWSGLGNRKLNIKVLE